MAANPRVFDLLGYDTERIMGLKVQNLQPNSELTRAREALETCLQAGSDQFESKLVHADKTIIDVEISSSLIDPTQGII